MPFQSGDLAALDRVKEIRIETERRGGPRHSTIIWAVVVDGHAYIRSYLGHTARWYREALANPDLVIRAEGRRILARAIPARDATIVAAVSDAYLRTYRRSRSAQLMVAPAIVDATLRLEPR